MQWEDKTLASERRVLLSNLVGEANEKVLNNDDICVNCFVQTNCLLECEASESDNLITLQGVCSKIIVPVTHVEALTGGNEFSAPSVVVAPKEDLGVEISLYEDIAENELGNNSSELIVYEEGDAELAADETLE